VNQTREGRGTLFPFGHAILVLNALPRKRSYTILTRAPWSSSGPIRSSNSLKTTWSCSRLASSRPRRFVSTLISRLVHNVFILRWQGPRFDDAASVLQGVRDASRSSTDPLVYIGIVPAGDSAPDMATRHELGRQLKELSELCICIHLVLEGGGFRAATQRAVATGMFLMMGRRDRVTAHASLSEALNCCNNLSAPVVEILATSRTLAAVPDGRPWRAAG
jgi:hypothetical protein